MKPKLLPFQAQGVRKISYFDGRCLIADDMGLGKTFQALEWIRRHDEYPAIIVCPASLKVNWQRECWDKIGVRAAVIYGRKPKRNDREFKRLLRESKVIIINYEILTGWRKTLYTLGARCLVVDECHRVTGRKTISTRRVRVLAEKIPNMLALSGTPMSNRPAELWPILNMLKPELWPAFTPFAIEFCNPTMNQWGQWEYKGARNLKRLNKRLTRHVMIRRRKKDVLKELPALRRQVIPLELSAADRKEYNFALRDLGRWLKERVGEDKAAKAMRAEALVKANYLKQIILQAKMKQIIEWLEMFFEDTDRKYLLFCVHKAAAKAFRDHFKGTSVVINGDTPKKVRQLNIDAFKSNPKIRLFIGNIKAAGAGLNLTEASDVGFAEVGWNPADLLQAEARCHRIGQTRKVNAGYFIGVNTIEEDLYKLLEKKQGYLEKALDGKATPEDLDIFQLLKEVLNNAAGQTIKKDRSVHS